MKKKFQVTNRKTIQIDYEKEAVISNVADHWPWEFSKYNNKSHTKRTWQSTYRFIELMVCMN